MSESIVTSSSIYHANKQPWEHAGHLGSGPLSSVEALRALGPLVYAVRLKDGLIKIGYSTDFARRRQRYGPAADVEMLAVLPGATRVDEQAIHGRLQDHVHHGWEYYYPTPDVLQVVNEMRERIGLDHLAA